MFRTDRNGRCVIYELEQLLDVTPGRLEWYPLAPGRLDFHERARDLDKAPFTREFSACGACWQKLGIHGTFDRAIAVKAFKRLVRYRRKGRKYRLVRRVIKIETVILGVSWK